MEVAEPTLAEIKRVFEHMRRENWEMRRDMIHFKRVIKSLHVFNNDMEKKVDAIDNRHVYNNILIAQNEIILMRVEIGILRRRIEELREELTGEIV